HERGRLSDNFRVTDHDDLEPGKLQARLANQLDRGRRGTGAQGKIVIDDVADRCRVHALDVLQRMDRRLQRPDVYVLRHRPLQDDAEHVRVVVHLEQTRFAFLLRQVRGPELLVEWNTCLERAARLVANVDIDLRAATDADRDQLAQRMLAARLCDAIGNLGDDAVAYGGAAQQPVVFVEQAVVVSHGSFPGGAPGAAIV